MIPFGTRKGPAENELDLLAGAIREKRFPKGHVFFTEGKSTTPALYLLREGRVSVRSAHHPNLESVLGFSLGDKEVKTIDRHGYFGNDTLGANKEGLFGVAMYTCVALEDVEAGVLDLRAIQSVASTKSEKVVKTCLCMEHLDMVRRSAPDRARRECARRRWCSPRLSLTLFAFVPSSAYVCFLVVDVLRVG